MRLAPTKRRATTTTASRCRRPSSSAGRDVTFPRAPRAAPASTRRSATSGVRPGMEVPPAEDAVRTSTATRPSARMRGPDVADRLHARVRDDLVAPPEPPAGHVEPQVGDLVAEVAVVEAGGDEREHDEPDDHQPSEHADKPGDGRGTEHRSGDGSTDDERRSEAGGEQVLHEPERPAPAGRARLPARAGSRAHDARRCTSPRVPSSARGKDAGLIGLLWRLRPRPR